MQKKYKARFVHGQEQQLLLKEVRARLARQIEMETRGWKQDFGPNVRMQQCSGDLKIEWVRTENLIMMKFLSDQ